MARCVRRGVALLDDRGNAPSRVPDDPPVAARVADPGGQHGDGVARRGVLADERGQRLAAQQRHVAVGDDDDAGHDAEGLDHHAHRVAGAEPGDPARRRPRPAAYRAASALTCVPAVPDDDHQRCGSSSPAAASACPSMLRPHSGCSTFGIRDFIRVPSPAARTMTAAGRVSLTRQVSSGSADICVPGASGVSPTLRIGDATANVFTYPSPAGYRPVAVLGGPMPGRRTGSAS